MEWQRVIGTAGLDDRGFDVVQLMDGGFAVAGTAYPMDAGYSDARLTKLDSAGVLVWDATFGGSGSDRAVALVSHDSGGFIIGGVNGSLPGGANAPWLVQTDTSGSLVWESTPVSSTLLYSSYSLSRTADGGLIWSGREGANNPRGLIVKVDGSGRFEWKRYVGGDEAESVFETGHNLVVIGGFCGTGACRATITMTDPEGATVWSRAIYGISNADTNANAAQVTADGGFVVAGNTGCFLCTIKSSNMWLAKLDGEGEVEWQTSFPDTGQADDLVVAADGGYALVGSTPEGPVVIRTDSQGNTLWVKPIGGMKYIRALTRTHDGGYILVGEVGEAPPASSVDMVVTKLAPDSVDGGSGYTLSGRVTDAEGRGVSGVTVSGGVGGSATTDVQGYYTISNLAPGTYTLTPRKAGYSFTPARRVVEVSGPVAGQDFWVVEAGTRFLDLPFDYSYTSFRIAANGRTSNRPDGRVNSWFDHSYPTYTAAPNRGTNNLTRYDGQRFDFTTVSARQGISWYDGHDGIDFAVRSGSTTVRAAAGGGVYRVVRHHPPSFNCYSAENGCSACGGNSLGNYVEIYHEAQGYYTTYAHLARVDDGMREGDTVRAGQRLGEMGNTGCSSGTHLHFAVRSAQAGSVVDPYSWAPEANALVRDDPWVAAGGPTSHYLWLHDLAEPATLDGATGGTATIAELGVSAALAPGWYAGEVRLELGPSSVAASSAELAERSTGRSFLLRLLEGVRSLLLPQSNLLTDDAPAGPLELIVAYTDADLRHLDPSGLVLARWNATSEGWDALPTIVDAQAREVMAVAPDFGFFDLQAPLLCPSETQEPNDTFYAAEQVQVNGSSVRLLDIADDEDWFSFEPIAGLEYIIETTNLAAGVDTLLELYDRDGLSLLATDDDGGGDAASRIEWQAPASGVYYARVTGASGSAYGCDAAYTFRVQGPQPQEYRLQLPLVQR